MARKGTTQVDIICDCPECMAIRIKENEKLQATDPLGWEINRRLLAYGSPNKALAYVDAEDGLGALLIYEDISIAV